MNAAVWFGATVFFALSLEPAASSQQMRELIGGNNFPYYSPAIGNLFATRFFHLYLICSVLAFVYLIAEWLYFGKYPPRYWLAFVLALVFLGLARGYWLQPTLKKLHDVRHGRASAVEQRESAARAYQTWAAVAKTIDLALAAGLAVYVWRVGNPADPMRFLSANKFRS